ncbi:MAG: glycosyltransferase family 2 protein [Dolichospermum sp.]
MITYSVLITNYNTWILTNRCIQFVNQWSKHNIKQILVVDDASSEIIPEHILISDQVKVIHNHENRGYVASVNRGFSELQEDIVILLDSDAYPLMDLTEAISQAFSNNHKLGAVGFQLVDEKGKPTGSHEKVPTAIELLLGQTLTSRINPYLPIKNKQIMCLYSCAIAVRREAFEEIGGFDEGFDFLDADIDFSIRLQQAGWEIQIIPQLRVFHTGGGSPQTTAKRVLRFHRNRWRLLSKHQLLPVPNLLKIGLAIRHISEYIILKICGHFLIQDSIRLKDKLYSRQELLYQVWNNYGNK